MFAGISHFNETINITLKKLNYYSTMDDLLKNALEGIDDDVVPKHTKRTSEEETTFVQLEKGDDLEKPAKKKLKLDEGETPVIVEDDEEDKMNHPEAVKLENKQDEQNKDDKRCWCEPCHQPHDGHRDTFGYRRHRPRIPCGDYPPNNNPGNYRGRGWHDNGCRGGYQRGGHGNGGGGYNNGYNNSRF